MALQPGATLGPFRVVAPLGRGGMASVSKAYEAALDRYVALKTLPAEFMHDPSFSDRFQREAKVIASLEHPNIVPIYAFGIDDGIPWMSMRLIAGGACSSLLHERRLERSEALRILQGVALALDHAHSKGIVHRDVKPQNVLLDQAGQVYLADFGIAKILEGSTMMTRTGMVTGTPEYMAPEQAQAQTVDHRADIYSLGILAYLMLTGRLPFQADTPVAVVMKHILEPLPLPSADEVPEPVARALMKCLDKKPEARWPSASAFVAALAKGIEGGGGGVPALEERATAVRAAAPAPPTVALPAGARTVRGPGPTVVERGVTAVERAAPRAAAEPRSLAVPLGAVAAGLIVVGALLYARLGTGTGPSAPAASATPAPAKAPDPGVASVTTLPAPAVIEAGPRAESAPERRAADPAPRTADAAPARGQGVPVPGPPVPAPGTLAGRIPSDSRGDEVSPDQARAVLQKQACDGGDMKGCNGLGWRYMRGTGVAKDPARAASLFKQACDGGGLLGCSSLGWALERGSGVSQDQPRAAGLYKRACDGGEMPGCSALGWAYVHGTGVSKDAAQAVVLFKRACDGGWLLGCNGLAWTHERGFGVPKDEARAATLYKQACDGGELQGCSSLGWLHVRGAGVPKDPAQGAALYKRACDGGGLLGCNGLAWAYMNGTGVSKDAAHATALFKQACDGGEMQACNGLGWAYVRGEGVPRDADHAVALFKQACDGGAMLGCHGLGSMYDRGNGAPRDEARAAALFKQACDGGAMVGCSGLAGLYDRGSGVPKDSARALALFKQACAGGEPGACANLKR